MERTADELLLLDRCLDAMRALADNPSEDNDWECVRASDLNALRDILDAHDGEQQPVTVGQRNGSLLDAREMMAAADTAIVSERYGDAAAQLRRAARALDRAARA